MITPSPVCISPCESVPSGWTKGSRSWKPNALASQSSAATPSSYATIGITSGYFTCSSRLLSGTVPCRHSITKWGFLSRRAEHLRGMIRLRRAGPVTQIAMARAVLGRPLFVACAYYLDGLLVDTGPTTTSRALVRLLDELPVQSVVLTHAHEDHSGANQQLQARGLTPLAHPLALGPLAYPPHQRPYQRVTWGRLMPSGAAPIGDEVATRAFHFRVLPTPGHSADHLSFFEDRTGWLFAGDLYLSAHVKVLRQGEDPHQSIASLRAVLSLPVTTLFFP